MGKYLNLKDDIYSIFDSAAWKAENITTHPGNFNGAVTGNYIRVSIIPSSSPEANPLISSSGQLLIDIFVEAGKGFLEAYIIADILDSYLSGKSVSTVSGNSTQFSSSALTEQGIDPDNKSLYRFKYSIPFNYFGVN